MENSKEKQIEQMAKKLCVAKICHEKKRANCIGLGDCHKSREVAEALYNAGYRKQSEGEWIYPTNEFNLPKCSVCGMTSHDATYAQRQYYCSHCGAKMKGGEE